MTFEEWRSLLEAKLPATGKLPDDLKERIKEQGDKKKPLEENLPLMQALDKVEFVGTPRNKRSMKWEVKVWYFPPEASKAKQGSWGFYDWRWQAARARDRVYLIVASQERSTSSKGAESSKSSKRSKRAVEGNFDRSDYLGEWRLLQQVTIPALKASLAWTSNAEVRAAARNALIYGFTSQKQIEDAFPLAFGAKPVGEAEGARHEQVARSNAARLGAVKAAAPSAVTDVEAGEKLVTLCEFRNIDSSVSKATLLDQALKGIKACLSGPGGGPVALQEVRRWREAML